ncbi:MAG: hypothetical protein QGG36_26155 [Pirellulaceae bacterium]|nr:hypothetical protein [Pirellulaceae bacterium]
MKPTQVDLSDSDPGRRFHWHAQSALAFSTSAALRQYMSGVDGALQRIAGQFPCALAADASVQFIGRCNNGRKIKGKIHKQIRDAGRKLVSAPGREWFVTTGTEVEKLLNNSG